MSTRISQDIGKLADDTGEVADNLLSLVDDTNPLREQLVLTIENGVCEAVGKTGNFDAVDEKIQDVINLLDDVGEFERGEMEAVKNTIEEAYTSVENMILDTLDAGGTYDRWLPLYTIPMMIIGCLLVLGSLLSWFAPKTSKRFFVLQTWITLPLLMLTIVVSIIIAGVIAPALIVNSGKSWHNKVQLSNMYKKLISAILTHRKTSVSVTRQGLQMEMFVA